jgi:lysine-ketoglutarate reductase/saccharopine dehydrogenase-like protein (TIGR00300 family)
MSWEKAKSQTVLAMSRPEHFGVQYEINPWMEGNIGRTNTTRARDQWDALHALLAERAEVRVMEPALHLPDMCFIANAGLVLEDVFVPAVFRVPQRAPEVPHFRQWLEEQDFTMETIDGDTAFEGEGDALFHPSADDTPLLWAGYGVRSGLLSHRRITEIFRCEVVSLRLVDQRFYHLDTCLTPLPDGGLMYYPAAFSHRSLETIHAHIPEADRVEVSTEDALGFCCNAVIVGQTLVANHASDDLRKTLAARGLEVITTPLDEFLLAGGAAKCLCLKLDQPVPGPLAAREAPLSPIRTDNVELTGHLLDRGVMNRALDTITDAGGSFRAEQFAPGLRHDQPSACRLRISAPSQAHLDEALGGLEHLGARILTAPVDALLEPAPDDGVAPDDFYSTTIYPTEIRAEGKWIRVTGQRMDVMIVVEEDTARCVLMRDLKKGDRVVCGREGILVHTPESSVENGDFAFMSAGVSTERRVERAIDELAWEMQRLRSHDGRVVVVAGPVVVHTGGAAHLARLIHAGHVQALLTGNALPAHDIELSMFGTSLGIDLASGRGVPHGHQHHLRAINRVRAAGSIVAAVEQDLFASGIMHACVKNNVDYVLAGSIRDDGPLPETHMNLETAQAEYASAIQGAEMILMLGTMLHAIGTGNMSPAGVRLVCVDINPAVVTKLADRGSLESTGIVTDVGLFLNLLTTRLCDSSKIFK